MSQYSYAIGLRRINKEKELDNRSNNNHMQCLPYNNRDGTREKPYLVPSTAKPISKAKYESDADRTAEKKRKKKSATKHGTEGERMISMSLRSRRREKGDVVGQNGVETRRGRDSGRMVFFSFFPFLPFLFPYFWLCKTAHHVFLDDGE